MRGLNLIYVGGAKFIYVLLMNRFLEKRSFCGACDCCWDDVAKREHRPFLYTILL